MNNNSLHEAGYTWENDTLCSPLNAELFFPEEHQSHREAKKICHACPVSQDCLDYALEANEKFGIWGGLNQTERKKLKRKSARQLGSAAVWHS